MVNQAQSSGPASRTIVVVGGGIAGISAAVEAAETGEDVILLEKGPSLGGRVAALHRYFPKLCSPACGLEINYQRLRANRRIRIMTMCEVTHVAGSRGAFSVAVRRHPRYVNEKCTACGDCARVCETTVPNPFNLGLDRVKAARLPHEHAFPARYLVSPEAIAAGEGPKLRGACRYGAIEPDEREQTFELSAGAIVWTTGWQPYDARRIDVYRYGHSPDIITNVQMERLAAADGPTKGRIVRPSNGQPAMKVALVQCAGSRDINHLPYCSRICCLASLKHAAYLREQYAEAQVDIYYIDLRAHDKLEAFYEKLRADPQVRFIKSKPAHIRFAEDGRPVLHGERTVDREIYSEAYDLVVLATGMQPVVPQRWQNSWGVEQDEYGFLVATAETDGVCPAGVASAPLDVSMSVQSATAAALKAVRAVRES
ncbi:MAG TPA: FAD-dependent oxidoreductase [Burkholderiaceae bacterium]|nr:FAD-dependent oxidoreductase [Burkholderiaceae bacterium]